MNISNTSSCSVARQETTVRSVSSSHRESVDVLVDEVEVERVSKKRGQQPRDGPSDFRSKKTRKAPLTAKDGIMTGSDFVIPPELVRLRKSSLVTALPKSISRYGLNRWIEDQIVKDGLEDEDLVELGPLIMRRFGASSPFHMTRVLVPTMYNYSSKHLQRFFPPFSESSSEWI